jgi:hypothetical protein
VLQFDEKHQSLAAKIFLQLKYFNHADVQALCKALYAHLPERVRASPDDVWFVGLGTPADSGGMLLYHYRLVNHLPEPQFLNIDLLHDKLTSSGEQPARHLVFLDDFIGTGGQATELLLREISEIFGMGSFGNASV